MTEPKLLTEAEAKALYISAGSAEAFVEGLNERGLIKPEPVDPLLIEAREICSKAFGVDYTGHTCGTRGALLATYNALRRGMELARLPAAALAAIDEQGE